MARKQVRVQLIHVNTFEYRKIVPHYHLRMKAYEHRNLLKFLKP